jgi:tetratricopeptide (TPR) repeat protein
MLSDDNEKYPLVNYNAVKDMEKLMSLPFTINFNNLIVTIHNLLHDLPNETIKKYIEQLIAELPTGTDAFWIAQILYAENCNERKERIDKYTEIINSVKEGKLMQIQCYCYSNRSKNYRFINEYEKALDDNAKYIKMLPLLPNERNRDRIDNVYFAMKDRTEILKEMKDTKGLINEYTKILETLFAEENVDCFITDTYMKRAKLYRKNNNIEKALADYSTVIELGVTGIEYKVKNAYAARIKINKELGEMEKVSADYKKLTELKEEDLLLGDCFDAGSIPEFEIINEV